MKMFNYIWLVVYILAGLYLLRAKDEFWGDFVPKLGYMGLWILWVFGIVCIIIGLSRQF